MRTRRARGPRAGAAGVSAALLHSGSAGLALVTTGLSGLNSSALTDELRLSGPSSQAPPPPSLPYKVDTSRPSLRTNWTRLVVVQADVPSSAGFASSLAQHLVSPVPPPPVLNGHVSSQPPY